MRSGTRPRARCRSASKAAGLDLILNPGEGAFYGPKLEFVLRDAIGRDWQCGTLQVDFVLPERLGASYVAEDGSRKRAGHAAPRHLRQLRAHDRHPDRALCRPLPALAGADASGGSHDRERCRLPMPRRSRPSLRAAGMRVDTDLRNEKINYKVREHSLAHVPLILAVGRRDMESPHGGDPPPGLGQAGGP